MAGHRAGYRDEIQEPTRGDLAAIQRDERLLELEIAVTDAEIAADQNPCIATGYQLAVARQHLLAERLTRQILRTGPSTTNVAKCWPDQRYPERTA